MEYTGRDPEMEAKIQVHRQGMKNGAALALCGVSLLLSLIVFAINITGSTLNWCIGSGCV